MSGLRILIADDHELMRRGLRNLLESQPDWHVVAEAKDGREALDEIAELKPDIVILDLAMPRLNGLETIRRITRIYPQVKILVLSMHDSDDLIRAVLEAGARGYVTKGGASQDLITAVDALRRNKTFFTPRVDQMLLDAFRRVEPAKGNHEDRTSMNRLTSRQREIVQLVAEGKSSKEVAVTLGVSVKTIETHRANLMKRLNCHSVGELVRYAIRNNIIQA